MKPFQPKGDVAQWRIIYDKLTKLDIGDILTYEEVFKALDIEPTKANRMRIHTPVIAAANRWGSERHRALMNVRNVGWTVADPRQQEAKARKQHRRGRRALARSRNTLRDVDRTLLSPDDRVRIDRMENELSRQSDMIKRIDIRQERMNKTLEADRAKHQATADKVERMEEALRRHGIEPE